MKEQQKDIDYLKGIFNNILDKLNLKTELKDTIENSLKIKNNSLGFLTLEFEIPAMQQQIEYLDFITDSVKSVPNKDIDIETRAEKDKTIVTFISFSNTIYNIHDILYGMQNAYLRTCLNTAIQDTEVDNSKVYANIEQNNNEVSSLRVAEVNPTLESSVVIEKLIDYFKQHEKSFSHCEIDEEDEFSFKLTYKLYE